MKPHQNRIIRILQWMLIYAILGIIVLLVTGAESIVELLIDLVL